MVQSFITGLSAGGFWEDSECGNRKESDLLWSFVSVTRTAFVTSVKLSPVQAGLISETSPSPYFAPAPAGPISGPGRTFA